MRLLFLHSNTQDYLADSLFHGLRCILGPDCVDVPRYDIMYSTLAAENRARLRGHGFTLYGLLPDIPDLNARRVAWQDQLDRYDLLVIANVWRQQHSLVDARVRSVWRKVVLVDGEDDPAFFPYAGPALRRPSSYTLGVCRRPYFKREWHGYGTDYRGFTRWFPQEITSWLSSPRNARKIAFSVPAEKICDFALLEKVKDFPRFIVDAEVAVTQSGAVHSAVGSDSYLFQTEDEYFADLRQSRYGITTKRSGWDCLRHYEIAANGCVMCFRDLDRKPPTCAPHGLNKYNCIIYRSAADLITKISSVSASQHQDLLGATKEWILANTTEARARRFLDTCCSSSLPMR
jgi:hypothetical protein